MPDPNWHLGFGASRGGRFTPLGPFSAKKCEIMGVSGRKIRPTSLKILLWSEFSGRFTSGTRRRCLADMEISHQMLSEKGKGVNFIEKYREGVSDFP